MNPKIMFVRVSENCNAGCFMCNFAHSTGKYNISNEQYDKLLNMMEEKGTYELIRFTGGEPLLHPNIFNFIKKAKKLGYKTSIITNGYLLPNFSKEIAYSGVDQVIVSIDGSTSEINDKLRGLKNGLERIKDGVNKIKKVNTNIIFRANTVASEQNIADLSSLYKMLNELSFDSWSIIPIRPTNSLMTKWNLNNIDNNKKLYGEFIKLQSKFKNVKLLGYSSSWAGITDEEINNTFSNKFGIKPRKQCNLVDIVRFYIPDRELIIPCNCAAHRIYQIQTEYDKEKNISKKADIMAAWLKENGVNNCAGCEPINAYLSDNPNIISENIFNY